MEENKTGKKPKIEKKKQTNNNNHGICHISGNKVIWLILGLECSDSCEMRSHFTKFIQ